MKFTAIGSGFYRVYKNGVEVSKHTSEREAIESAVNIELADPASSVTYKHDYEVKVESDTASPTPPPVQPPPADQLQNVTFDGGLTPDQIDGSQQHLMPFKKFGPADKPLGKVDVRNAGGIKFDGYQHDIQEIYVENAYQIEFRNCKKADGSRIVVKKVVHKKVHNGCETQGGNKIHFGYIYGEDCKRPSDNNGDYLLVNGANDDVTFDLVRGQRAGDCAFDGKNPPSRLGVIEDGFDEAGNPGTGSGQSSIKLWGSSIVAAGTKLRPQKVAVQAWAVDKEVHVQVEKIGVRWNPGFPTQIFKADGRPNNWGSGPSPCSVKFLDETTMSEMPAAQSIDSLCIEKNGGIVSGRDKIVKG